VLLPMPGSGLLACMACKHTTGSAVVPPHLDATSCACCCRFSGIPASYDAAYAAVMKAFLSAFFGPAKGGVLSPSVQYTLFQMGQAALNRCGQCRCRGIRCLDAGSQGWTFLLAAA
jgi:hypothetical protein